MEVLVPQFIKSGDMIRLDLATLKYMDRAKEQARMIEIFYRVWIPASRGALSRGEGAAGVQQRNIQNRSIHFHRFVELMEGENTFLRRARSDILGDLASAYCEHQVEGVLDRMPAPISGHEMIGASNAIMAAGRWRGAAVLAGISGIAAAAIEVRRGTDADVKECRNVAIGTPKSLDDFLQHVRNRRRRWLRAQATGQILVRLPAVTRSGCWSGGDVKNVRIGS